MSAHLKIVPLTLREANEFVTRFHRHHKPVVGHRFAIGVKNGSALVGVAIVGRPVSREIDQYMVAEVTRLCTDGTQNACSILYAACARIAREMGFTKIQTYVLAEELGTSLKASSWKFEAMTTGGNWNNSGRDGRREDQPMTPKQRWGKVLNANRSDKA